MNSKRIFWGALLILGGLFFLLKQYGILFFHIDWIIWRKLWPVFIILLGVRLLLPKENKSIGIILILAVVGIFAFSIYQGLRLKHVHENGFGQLAPPDLETPGPLSPFADTPDEASPSDPGDRQNSSSGNPLDSSSGGSKLPRSFSMIHQQFSVLPNASVHSVSLYLTGDAGQFTADVSPTNLFEANAETNRPYRLERTALGNEETIRLVSQNQEGAQGPTRSGRDSSTEKVNIRMNPAVGWQLNLNLGRGKVDYDLSGYQVEKIIFSTGAPQVRLKLGRMIPGCSLEIHAGMSHFQLLVPKSSGCQIHVSGGGIGKIPLGFSSTGPESYQTEGYGQSDRKITVEAHSPLPEFSVVRY